MLKQYIVVTFTLEKLTDVKTKKLLRLFDLQQLLTLRNKLRTELESVVITAATNFIVLWNVWLWTFRITVFAQFLARNESFINIWNFLLTFKCKPQQTLTQTRARSSFKFTNVARRCKDSFTKNGYRERKQTSSSEAILWSNYLPYEKINILRKYKQRTKHGIKGSERKRLLKKAITKL